MNINEMPNTIHDLEKMDKYIDHLMQLSVKTEDFQLATAAFFLRMFNTVHQGSIINGNTRRPILDQLLIGKEVKARHPTTVLNPNETFKITEYRIEYNRLTVRGEDTCWFSIDLIDFKE